jgi:hypothetical protein
VAIPSEACGEPVHEQSVKCPHCGGPTGVPVDPIAKTAIETMRPMPVVAQPPSTGLEPIESGFDPVGTALRGVGKVIEAASGLVTDDADDDDGLPRAVARTRQSKRRS